MMLFKLITINLASIIAVIFNNNPKLLKLLRIKKLNNNLVGLIFTTLIFLFSLNLWIFFNRLTYKFQYLSKLNYLKYFNLDLILGIDGISLFFILLTTFIMPICIISSWSIINRVEYILSLLFLELFLLLSFSTLDFFFFFSFWKYTNTHVFYNRPLRIKRQKNLSSLFIFYIYSNRIFISSFFLINNFNGVI